MRPFFDGKEAVEYWLKNGGYLCYVYSRDVHQWWHATDSIPGYCTIESTSAAIISAGYTEQEASEMMEGK